jgi:hypothetical protein
VAQANVANAVAKFRITLNSSDNRSTGELLPLGGEGRNNAREPCGSVEGTGAVQWVTHVVKGTTEP